MDFTGGKDTRAILSVLMSNNIKPDSITWIMPRSKYSEINDIEITSDIVRDFELNQIIHDCPVGAEKNYEFYNQSSHDYDIVFSGA